MINKDQLIFDPAELASSDDVGAYLRSSDGTLLTHTDVGGKKSLDVNVANTVAVSATNLDIRDLVFASDKVDVSGSSVELGATTLAALENISAIVTATDLDIRNLDYSQDNVAIKGSTGNQLVVNADGSINANVDVSVSNGSDKAEDAAHVSGDIGTYILSVREDVLSASTSASGDYQSLKTDKLGRAYINDSNQSAAFSAVVVAATATDLVPTDLVNRKSILIQNIGTKNIFIGNSGVTVSNGIRLSSGSSAEFAITDNVNVYAIAQTGTSEVRVMELA